METNLRAQDPPFALRSELIEAAANHGYRRQKGLANGWLFFASEENVPGEIALAVSADGSAWFLAVEHPGVAERLDAASAAPPPGRFRGAFGFVDQIEMRRALSRAWQLASSLPTLPLAEYEVEVRGLGDTEAERLVKQRKGQDIFRRALLLYWDAQCAVTGIAQLELLRASHIVPWALCRHDAERLDAENGLLLAAHWDAAFDKGLVSFTNEGRAIYKPNLHSTVLELLQPETARLRLVTPKHKEQLSWHRRHFGFGDG
ncbi:HNH endonuclease [Sphingomonas daechungensis]|uniref:HNH endonuclease n=2 Tax=Sphingomonas daechungensis TaxID=1176646 RepID=A0ABX6T1T9_9SPHN|nr:HNH endonuclease [Sphingomonas daechungensis]